MQGLIDYLERLIYVRDWIGTGLLVAIQKAAGHFGRLTVITLGKGPIALLLALMTALA